MKEIVKVISFNGLEKLTLQQMIELKLFDIISIRNYLIKCEYDSLLEEGEKSRDAMRILANTTWMIEDERRIKLGIKSIERIVYPMKDY